MLVSLSSAEEDSSGNTVNGGLSSARSQKKRRLQRACDMCRLKKVRCDGGQMSRKACTHCIAANYDCTYLQTSKRRSSEKSYVETLENRLKKLESFLSKMPTAQASSLGLGGTSEHTSSSKTDRSFFASSSYTTERNSPAPSGSCGPQSQPVVYPLDANDIDPSDDEACTRQSLESRFGNMSLDLGLPSYFGKSSAISFFRTVLDMKNDTMSGDSATKVNHNASMKRQDFWTPSPWIEEAAQEERVTLDFPDTDLMWDLVDLYFKDFNYNTPLLHRPTFEGCIRDGLHLRHDGFGCTVLLVSALGARSSTDPRVLLPGSNNPHSIGWQWFSQVYKTRRMIYLGHPEVYDLQIASLACMYLMGTSSPQSSWSLVGSAIRRAQDMGAHRRIMYKPKANAEDELMKRAFWVLIVTDRAISNCLGRPCGIQEEEFDLDLPIECDDEYWMVDDPELAFKQPPGKPSKMAFFNSFLRLNYIHGFALRTIYAINKSKIIHNATGPESEESIVTALDSALNKWADSVPEHLRWDPHMEDVVFFNQSAVLYSAYYALQITVHRPFIPVPNKKMPHSFPSLAICTNAARSCIHILHAQCMRMGDCLANQVFPQIALFNCTVVLLLNLWGAHLSGSKRYPTKEIEEVNKAMAILKALEKTWHTAGRLWDVLNELANVGEVPIPPERTFDSKKRARDSDTSISATGPSVATTEPTPWQAPSASQAEIKKESTISTMPHHAQTGDAIPNSDDPISQQWFPPNKLPLHSTELSGFYSHPTPNADGTVPSSSTPSATWWSSSSGSSSTSPSSISNTHFTQQPVSSSHTDGIIGAPSIDTLMFGELSTALLRPAPSSMLNSATTGASPSQSAMGGYTTFSNPGVGTFQDMGPDPETMAVWASAPMGFEWDSWGNYITNFGGLPSSFDETSSSSQPSMVYEQ